MGIFQVRGIVHPPALVEPSGRVRHELKVFVDDGVGVAIDGAEQIEERDLS
jgi:hypothetical protein